MTLCRGYRFPKAIIRLAIWLYLRFILSLRGVEELLAGCPGSAGPAHG